MGGGLKEILREEVFILRGDSFFQKRSFFLGWCKYLEKMVVVGRGGYRVIDKEYTIKI